MISNRSRIRFHAAFEMALDELIAVVAKEKERDPESYRKAPSAKLLARIYKAIKDEVPDNPEHPAYYQGETRGYPYCDWRRAQLGDQHRLFFKVPKESNYIIYAWVHSEVSLAKYRSHMEAYREFRRKARKERG